MNSEITRPIVEAIQAGRLTEAESLCRFQLTTRPQDEHLLMLLAIGLHLQKRFVDAAVAYAELTKLRPDNSAHWYNYGLALLESGASQEAEAAFATSIRLDPHNPAPKIQIGLLHIQRKEYVAAREMLLDAFDLDNELPLARIHAAHACCLCQDFQGAEDLLRPWRQWLPLNDDGLQLELAKLLQLMSQIPMSVPLLEDIVARNPLFLNAVLLLANTYERLNQLEKAQSILQAIHAQRLSERHEQEGIENEIAHLHAALALRKGHPADAKDMLEHCGPRHAGDYAHFYELADAADKLGETDATMRALQTAHALQVEELKIASSEFFAADAPALPANVPRVSAEAYGRWQAFAAPAMRDSPVFIVGFPRSGTTLLEQMLDAHPSLQSMDENPFFNRLADKLKRHDEGIMSKLEQLQQRDCDELRKLYLIMVSEKIRRRWNAQLVDKNPLNMLWLPLIHRLFPNAKFILAVRHPCDVILSCYMQNFRSSILGAACADLKRLAAAYVQAMNCWLEDVQVFQPNVLVSRYEDLVSDFPAHAARIARFLELDDPTPMLRFDQHARDKGYIATPSYDQVIEPVNRKGMNRWMKYRREFEPVLPIVEPMLRHWLYPVE